MASVTVEFRISRGWLIDLACRWHSLRVLQAATWLAWVQIKDRGRWRSEVRFYDLIDWSGFTGGGGGGELIHVDFMDQVRRAA